METFKKVQAKLNPTTDKHLAAVKSLKIITTDAEPPPETNWVENGSPFPVDLLEMEVKMTVTFNVKTSRASSAKISHGTGGGHDFKEEVVYQMRTLMLRSGGEESEPVVCATGNLQGFTVDDILKAAELTVRIEGGGGRGEGGGAPREEGRRVVELLVGAGASVRACSATGGRTLWENLRM